MIDFMVRLIHYSENHVDTLIVDKGEHSVKTVKDKKRLRHSKRKKPPEKK